MIGYSDYFLLYSLWHTCLLFASMRTFNLDTFRFLKSQCPVAKI
jgi:hypothetical protein